MARYEREFLVPYLEDICALYMCKDVLNERVRKNKVQIDRINAPIKLEKPTLTTYDPWHGNKFMVFGFGTLFLMGIIAFFAPSDTVPTGFKVFLGLFAVLLGGIPMISGIKGVRDTVLENAENERDYYEQMQRYDLARKRAMDNKKAEAETVLPQLCADRELYRKEIERCDELLRMAYDADVIPTKYRDKYVAMYLYDWFKHNRRADDMDLALNTFVLEEIKSRLDKMIELQRETIIQQRIMIAQQRVALEEQQKHHAYMEKKVKEIAANQEEEKQYLEMIESNTAANAFFTAACYLEKH